MRMSHMTMWPSDNKDCYNQQSDEDTFMQRRHVWGLRSMADSRVPSGTPLAAIHTFWWQTGDCLKQALEPASVARLTHDTGWSSLLQHSYSCELAALDLSC